jgi:hypothetical protein
MIFLFSVSTSGNLNAHSKYTSQVHISHVETASVEQFSAAEDYCRVHSLLRGLDRKQRAIRDNGHASVVSPTDDHVRLTSLCFNANSFSRLNKNKQAIRNCTMRLGCRHGLVAISNKFDEFLTFQRTE